MGLIGIRVDRVLHIPKTAGDGTVIVVDVLMLPKLAPIVV